MQYKYFQSVLFLSFFLQVLCTLRYLAKADFFSEVGDLHGISKASMSLLLPRVCRALCQMLDNIRFPSSQQSINAIKQNFYDVARFPNVVGAIDGTLIPIRGVGGDEEPICFQKKLPCSKYSGCCGCQHEVNAPLMFKSKTTIPLNQINSFLLTCDS